MEKITWVGTPSSSNVIRIGYDAEVGHFYVEFSTGKTYKYLDVPYSVWNRALEAPSIGKYVNKVLKDGYKFEEA